MRITCPYCGERSNDEFIVLGDAEALLNRPTDMSVAAFDDYVHKRNNPAGPLRELWYHQGGCRQWLVVDRDTLTHVILGITFARAFRQVS